MNSLVLTNVKKALCKDEIIKFTIEPFVYTNGKKPRLPRKSSKGYNLREDINTFFNYIFDELNIECLTKKFEVNIVIYKGNDLLGKADLDNYAKAILDGVTSTKKIWLDDNKIDLLSIRRVYCNNQCSYIEVEIKIVSNNNNVNTT